MNTLLRFPQGRDRALTLSYDDGVNSDLPLMEILDAHGIRATFNINTASFAPEGMPMPDSVNTTEIRRLSKNEAVAAYKNSPHEVAVHALTHPFLQEMPASLVTYEVMEDRKNVEELFGTVCRGMAYPYGAFNDTVVSCLRDSGIVYSRTTVSTGRFDIPVDWLRMPATCHHNDPRLPELCDSFLKDTPGRPARLFYLWGHSYEFSRNQNWHIIRDFAEKMGGNDKIWYATNIEIYDYVTAFRRLEYSANGRRVHNPTALDLWLSTGGDAVCIPSGATVEI
jgi:peptidoglycan/xylan/chitin deacetylase (PgdA/CDA1 family)